MSNEKKPEIPAIGTPEKATPAKVQFPETILLTVKDTAGNVLGSGIFNAATGRISANGNLTVNTAMNCASVSVPGKFYTLTAGITVNKKSV